MGMGVIEKEDLHKLEMVAAAINGKYLKNCTLAESLMIIELLKFDVTSKVYQRNLQNIL